MFGLHYSESVVMVVFGAVSGKRGRKTSIDIEAQEGAVSFVVAGSVDYQRHKVDVLVVVQSVPGVAVAAVGIVYQSGLHP